ncbi:radical SAM/SPASM domain-containing protein [Proteiniphilum sp. X52]|uniref:radical SAM/SPASM domain-containing protein n=1 Tax=Proteiniphilum sp. X52 TaxID=2382159 RepID=UPI000F0A9531|nr:radical SAM protein [Proteiniphilum sp. X52]RNC63503.1 SPASM domain-containing protein [Proteiniphilum sp. X52]
MKWSRYNYLYESKRHNCFLLYNSITNVLISLSIDVYRKLCLIKNGKDSEPIFRVLEEETLDKLIKAKIFVEDYDDENFILQKKFLKYKKSFQEKILSLVLLPTYACNFNCPYCYEAGLPYIFMKENVEDMIIDFINSFEVSSKLQLCWHGGEPLIAFNNIKRILTKIEKNEKKELKSHALVTNGYLLDKDKCLFFNDHNLNLIQITIDGLKENHNKSRIHKSGYLTYDVILNNIENVFKYIPQCSITIRMNVHAENEEDFPLLYEELKNRWEGQKYHLVMKYANKHNDSCRVECFNEKDKIFYAKKLFENYNFTNFNLYPKFQLGGCTATYSNSFVIDPEGDIYKCWVDVGKKERRIGNIFTRKYNSFLLTEYILGTDMYSDPKCLKCLLFPVCDGGCNLRRLNFKLNKAPYDLCPIDIENLDILFDMFYEQQLNTKVSKTREVKID